MVVALAFGFGLLIGCATPGRPPVADRSPVFEARPEYYVVRAEDTLYSIALRYQLDFRGLARANGLRPPFTIYAEQRIRLRAQGSDPPKPRVGVLAAKSPARLNWAWPVTAPVVRGYSPSNKGVDFQLKVGDTVRAAAAGEVVYAGNGLGRYAHLVIIKHNEQYLSAYSLDAVSIVQEGARIKAGGDIADISLRGRNKLALHFEIRRNGKAVDPRTLIVR
jgi:lipoprotein NlpD